MNVCKDCGRAFEDDELVKAKTEEGETWCKCPNCGSTDIVEKNRQCPFCDEYILDEENWCDWCKEDIERDFKNFLNKNFSDEQMPEALELISQMIEGM